MKKLFTLTFILTTQVGAQSGALTQEFKDQIQRSKLGPISEQAYCYSENGQIHGYQINKLQRIASLTKLFTTYLAAETLDLNQTFKTKIYIAKDHLHIEGGNDPYFEEDKLLILLKSLNDLGYKSFKKVTMSRSFLFYDLTLGSYKKVTPNESLQRLSFYFKSKNASGINQKWRAVKVFAQEEGIELTGMAPKITATLVSISDANPLLRENPIIYVHESKPLHALIKAMNVQSKNYLSHNIYDAGSKIKSFGALMKSKGVAESSFKIYNGSGLPNINGQTRTDNLATCNTVLKVIDLLTEKLESHGLILSDVVAINGGKDLGSFRERFEKYPETHEAVLAKTGTLKHTSSLAGVLSSQTLKPFAILNHSTSPITSRNFQDKFVARMFDYLGAAEPWDYEKISIFPWDGSYFLE
jgi:D-alanyl-D-alanine carboxypeptidase/D-alanyl-D-alanine-endopeptidase (penicillin-binding protein 4)